MARKSKTNRWHSESRCLKAPLRFEPLESRRLLAVFSVSSIDDAGPATLRQAISDANANPGHDTINFAAALTGQTIVLDGSELSISDAVTITAAPFNGVTIDADNRSRIFDIVADDGDFTFSGLTLTRGLTVASFESGAAIRSMTSGKLTVSNSTITDNGTIGFRSDGGAIYAKADVDVIRSIVTNNRATGTIADGGGIFSDGNVSVTNSSVSGNTSDGSGGGINARDLTLTGTLVDGNESDSYGGGVRVLDLVMTQSSISGNSSANDGGGVRATRDVVAMDSAVNNNQGRGYGGGISTSGGDLYLVDTAVSGNTTTAFSAIGGGLFTYGTVTMLRSTVHGNSVSSTSSLGDGGGIWADGEVTLTESVISGNSTDVDGGGIWSGSDVELIRSSVRDNIARDDGGGVRARGKVTLLQSTVSGNETQSNSGGGIWNLGDFMMTLSTISGNTSGDQGGGVQTSGDVTIVESTVTGNTSDRRGGGIRSYYDDVTIRGSIVAGNVAGTTGNDLNNGGIGDFVVTYSLIGDNEATSLVESQSVDANGNLIGSSAGQGTIVPGLAALSSNGGTTQTHALLSTSPALNSGDPSSPAIHDFDQRNAGYKRVSGGRIDMGSYELQPPPCDLDGDGDCDGDDIDMLQENIVVGPPDLATFDLDQDGTVSVVDRDLWLALAGAENLPSRNPYLIGDANLDGNVDGQDFVTWNNHKFTTTSAWTDGDFTADGIVNGQDFVVWNGSKFTSSDALAVQHNTWRSSEFAIQSREADSDEEEQADISTIDAFFSMIETVRRF